MRSLKIAGIALALFILLAASGSSANDPEDPPPLTSKLKRLAGNEPLDCGFVRVWSPTETANNCALVAFRRHKPFFVRYAVQGIDTLNFLGYAGDSRGDVYEVNYWRGIEPYGGASDVVKDSRISVEKCSKAVNLRKANSGFLTCFLRDP